MYAEPPSATTSLVWLSADEVAKHSPPVIAPRPSATSGAAGWIPIWHISIVSSASTDPAPPASDTVAPTRDDRDIADASPVIGDPVGIAP